MSTTIHHRSRFTLRLSSLNRFIWFKKLSFEQYPPWGLGNNVNGVRFTWNSEIELLKTKQFSYKADELVWRNANFMVNITQFKVISSRKSMSSELTLLLWRRDNCRRAGRGRERVNSVTVYKDCSGKIPMQYVKYFTHATDWTCCRQLHLPNAICTSKQSFETSGSKQIYYTDIVGLYRLHNGASSYTVYWSLRGLVFNELPASRGRQSSSNISLAFYMNL